MSGTITALLVLVGLPTAFTIVALAADLVMRRPKLIVAGSGGGGSADRTIARHASLIIGNKATIWGLKVSRETAEVIGAWLYEEDTGEVVGTNLHFLQPMGGWGGSAKIAPGATVELRLFSVWEDGEYAMYAPEHEKTPSRKPARPFPAERARYVLQVRDKIGRDHRFRLAVKSRRNGLAIRYPWTLEMRINMFRSGLQKMARAFMWTPHP